MRGTTIRGVHPYLNLRELKLPLQVLEARVELLLRKFDRVGTILGRYQDLTGHGEGHGLLHRHSSGHGLLRTLPGRPVIALSLPGLLLWVEISFRSHAL